MLFLCIREYFWQGNLKVNEVFLKTNNFFVIQGFGVTFLKKKHYMCFLVNILAVLLIILYQTWSEVVKLCTLGYELRKIFGTASKEIRFLLIIIGIIIKENFFHSHPSIVILF